MAPIGVIPALRSILSTPPAAQVTLYTNVLARLLTNNDPAQAQLATALKLTQAAREP